ncbi:right-handed parallel beta-helix repeat-containing protein [Rossellomorea marisflavi]|uniref:right-handed parallel beta-helix repeat-containing protein n=1 Tax=Rossellomorea marisflavi TaxID=189381 RepID=UPI0025B02867|nr:right-handed parallel beta-helix repeat-containing protein [Rossellomorea marisflavi]WJV20678.1 right-handed parallel beta-helix repeat-containing protein [Rossellomorea marisflavi]
MFSDKDIYNDPVISKRRKGTPDDPFLGITETLQIENGRVTLSEIPNRMNKVKAQSSHGQWREELKGAAQQYKFKVDYTEGVVFFDSSHNGKSVTFTYLGEGVHLFPAQRVYFEDKGYIVGIKDKFNRVDLDIKNQKERVDEQIRSVPQPSEVVDLRVDGDGNVFRTAKERVDNEQRKMHEASIDSGGKVYPTLRDRINGEEKKILDALSALDGKKFNTLAERLDYLQGESNTLKRRIVDTVSDLLSGTFPVGEYVETRGYHDVNDAGGAMYKIKDAPTSFGERLSNGTYAHIVAGNEINPRKFGAKGNGIYDDAPAIQKSLDYVLLHNGGVVRLTSGDYVLNSTLYTYQDTSIVCDSDANFKRNHTSYMLMNAERGANHYGYKGNGNLLISGGVWDAAGAAVQNMRNTFALGHAENIIIRDLIIKDTSGSHAIEINACRDVLIENCRFMGFYDTGDRDFSEAIQLDLMKDSTYFGAFGAYDHTPCENITIRNCHFGASGTIGTKAWGRGVGSHSSTKGVWHQNITIVNNYFDNLSYQAVRAYNWRDVIVHGNHILNCGAGIQIQTIDPLKTKDTQDANGVETGTSQSCHNINISDNIIDGGGSHTTIIGIKGEASGIIYNVSITGNKLDNISVNSAGTLIQASYANNVTISNNSLSGGRFSSIDAQNAKSVTIANNIVNYSGDCGIRARTNNDGVTIQGNQVHRSASYGIYVSDNTRWVTLTGNVVTGSSGEYQIAVTNAVSYVTLNGNILRRTTGNNGGIQLTSTCSHAVLTGNIYNSLDNSITLTETIVNANNL